MYHIIYFIGRFYCFLRQRLSDFFWRHYLLAYCRMKTQISMASPRCVRFSGRCLLSMGEEAYMSIGNNVVINSGNHTISPGISKLNISGGGKLLIHNDVGMSSVSIICKDSITIGKHTNIGAGCLILDSDMHSLDWELRSTKGQDTTNAKTAPVHIGDYVFIGARSIIGKGVTIGEKSIIAAGSVVTRNVPAGEIWGGNPAQFLKKVN